MLSLFAGCAGSGTVYVNPQMDFGSIQTVAVMPLLNLTKDEQASLRVRDAFMNRLLATEAFYVLPPGEVTRGIRRAGISDPATPSIEEIKKLRDILKVDAVISGVLREYGTARSGASSANIVSLSLQMTETQTGTIVWTGSSTRGGITVWDRLFGGGGEPMNEVTSDVIEDLIDKLFE